MIIYIFTPVEFLLSINCYLSESYLMFGIGIGTCVACVAWIIWYQMIGKNFEKNVHEFVWGRSGYETVDIDENAIKIDGQLEERRMKRFEESTVLFYKVDDILFRQAFSVHTDALAEINKMRRCV